MRPLYEGHTSEHLSEALTEEVKVRVIVFTECINFFCPAVKHSLKYITTASSGLPDLPEYTAAAVVDEDLVLYCDGSNKILKPKHDWVKKVLEDDPHHLEYYKITCFEIEPPYFNDEVNRLIQRFNQSGGTVCTMLFHLLLHELFFKKKISRICIRNIWN